ncbi:hypothetical protein RKD25_009329 [Streptomyces sp. SAI-124]
MRDTIVGALVRLPGEFAADGPIVTGAAHAITEGWSTETAPPLVGGRHVGPDPACRPGRRRLAGRRLGRGHHVGGDKEYSSRRNRLSLRKRQIRYTVPPAEGPTGQPQSQGTDGGRATGLDPEIASTATTPNGRSTDSRITGQRHSLRQTRLRLPRHHRRDPALAPGLNGCHWSRFGPKSATGVPSLTWDRHAVHDSQLISRMGHYRRRAPAPAADRARSHPPSGRYLGNSQGRGMQGRVAAMSLGCGHVRLGQRATAGHVGAVGGDDEDMNAGSSFSSERRNGDSPISHSVSPAGHAARGADMGGRSSVCVGLRPDTAWIAVCVVRMSSQRSRVFSFTAGRQPARQLPSRSKSGGSSGDKGARGPSTEQHRGLHASLV